MQIADELGIDRPAVQRAIRKLADLLGLDSLDHQSGHWRIHAIVARAAAFGLIDGPPEPERP